MDKQHATQKYSIESNPCYARTTPTKTKSNVQGKRPPKSIRKKTEIVGRRKHHRTCDRTTEDMKNYIQPPLKRDPDQVIIHVGTNDLRSNQDPVTIAKNIIDIAKSSKTNKNEILLSSIVPRRDSLNGKGRQVNNILQKLCIENNFAYVNHDNIKPRRHCNYGGIHLNTAGSKILAENFILALSRQT